MRWVICALVVLALPSSAFAGDFDALRGSQTVGPANFTNWSGFYVGGQFGYSNAQTDFSNATSSLTAFSLRELALEEDDSVSAWPVLANNASTSGTTYGGFAGYNTQWQDMILGFEGGYTRASLNTVATSTPLSRFTSAGGNTYDVTVDGSASLKLVDYGSLRVRAGWIYDNFLPYGFAGFVLGRADYARSSLVFGQQNPSTPPVVPCNTTLSPTCVDFSFSDSDGRNSVLLYGWSLGGGLDVALTQNIFLRAEFEYVRFAPLADMVVSVTTGRVGTGIKF
jgi:outer membrane immunogenic protein